MALYIQKFGGTSVGSLERIQNVARLIQHTFREGHQLVVVLSAMSGETDRLMKMAKTLSVDPDDRELDVLLSSGERVTIALMAMTLKGLGIRAQSFTGRQVGIVTDSTHTKARVSRVDTDRVLGALRDGIVPIVAGFQGINAASDVTTLGRGGSDLTAVVLAAALKADTCFIYTDVDGVYTADPNIVPGARRLDKISYEEMLELASLGAKVLQSRSVELAAKYQVPVEVRSSFQDGPGTCVVKEDVDMEEVLVSGVTGDRNQAKVTVVGVPDHPGIAATLFCSIADAAINVDMIIQNVSQDSLTDISFTVPRADLPRGMGLIRDIAKSVEARTVEVNESIAKVSLVGVGMRSHSGVAARMFQTLSREGINIMMISTSEIKISCVVEEKYMELAVRALHQEFELEVPPGSRKA
ncbi:aspartate kinase [Candidatus Nitrospira neomarina]|uniref:Aspartokinase n=1 Tax=Candidatus Nitrospira neomarina TaxID=3020899 RepID=A0AA96GI23_9BACT|nr:aspartate kinase [Candidatus Nitrospira neomarina]